jgi:hypothetical protein
MSEDLSGSLQVCAPRRCARSIFPYHGVFSVHTQLGIFASFQMDQGAIRNSNVTSISGQCDLRHINSQQTLEGKDILSN